MLKVIIDTNIWISALMKSPLTRPILKAFIEEKFITIVSDELLKELNDTLNEPEVKRLINSNEAKELITLINEKSHKLKPTLKLDICRDPKDNFIISLVMESKAPLVSLDKDLLVLKSFRGITIIKPKEFLNRLNK